MTNSVAVITGASQGIGRATAVRLARDFSALVLVARNRANLESTAGLARDAGAEVLVMDADLGEVPAARAVVDKTLSKFGRIDALLNIAGAVPQIDLFEMNDVQWDAGLALKLHGARRLTIAAWPALVQKVPGDEVTRSPVRSACAALNTDRITDRFGRRTADTRIGLLSATHGKTV
jgi:3-oxoacyl-[acyl-carrier protein] reductase